MFPVGKRGLVLVSFGSFYTKAWVDFGSAHVVTYGVFFGFFKFIFVTYAISADIILFISGVFPVGERGLVSFDYLWYKSMGRFWFGSRCDTRGAFRAFKFIRSKLYPADFFGLYRAISLDTYIQNPIGVLREFSIITPY